MQVNAISNTHMWAAIWSQKFGIPVLPCGPDKAPLHRDGKLAATTDLEQIYIWWETWPDALIGGRADGLVILDFDAYKSGHDTDLKSVGELPSTRSVRTPGRDGIPGRHLFYRGQRRSGKLGPNKTIDIRGGLSQDYVILPPSKSREGVYEVSSWLPLADAPAWLLTASEPIPMAVQMALPAIEPLPPGVKVMVPPLTDKSTHVYVVVKQALRAGLTDGQVRNLVESVSSVNAIRLEEAKRQQPGWWPAEFMRCLTSAKSEISHVTPVDEPYIYETEPEDGKSTDKQRVMRLAVRDYELIRSPENVAYGVPRVGPRVVRQLKGGVGSMRSVVAAQFEQEFGHSPSNNALAEMITVLEGQATLKPATPLPMRTAWHDGEIVIDMGDPTGRAIVIGPGVWKVVDESPVLFRRTDLIGELPAPVRGGKLKDTVFPLLNLPSAERSLLIACVLSWLFPDIDHPVVYLKGEEGTAKSSMARLLRSLVDPSLVPVRRQPGRDEDWEVTIAGQPVIVLDNLSNLPDWLSDAICTAVTGTGDVKRRKYSDQDLSVVSVRRSFILTSIDVLVSRGDLVDRSVLFEPEPLQSYITQTSLSRTWKRDHPFALGALLDLACAVLAVLPSVAESGDYNRERMSDFVQICAAMDRVTHSSTVSSYRQKVAEGIRATVETDAFAVHVLSLAEQGWTGTAQQLYATYHGRLDRGTDASWPKGPAAVGMRLGRLGGMLRKSGVEAAKRRSERGMVWTLRKVLDMPRGPYPASLGRGPL